MPPRLSSSIAATRAVDRGAGFHCLRGRHRGNQLVRRKGRVYVINKTQPRFKARQG